LPLLSDQVTAIEGAVASHAMANIIVPTRPMEPPQAPPKGEGRKSAICTMTDPVTEVTTPGREVQVSARLSF